jgi:hypothetical protein
MTIVDYRLCVNEDGKVIPPPPPRGLSVVKAKIKIHFREVQVAMQEGFEDDRFIRFLLLLLPDLTLRAAVPYLRFGLWRR